MVEHNQSVNHPAGVGYSNKYKFNDFSLEEDYLDDLRFLIKQWIRKRLMLCKVL